MILSYESLLKDWIKKGHAHKIISINHNKIHCMDFFLSRDSQLLMDLVKENDRKTLLALLRCFDEETLSTLKETGQADDQIQILIDLEKPHELSKSFLQKELHTLLNHDNIIL